MKTTLDFIQILFDHIQASDLMGEVTGDVYKMRRPLDSDMEDVVINCLPVDSEQLQRTVANVNIYVPSLPIASAKGESLVPDTERLLELEHRAVALLRSVRARQDYHFEVQRTSLFEDAASGSYFINIRVAFYAYNFNPNP